MTDWIQRAKDYAAFLEQDEPELHTQAEARRYLREELENIIAINGYGELYEQERKLCHELGMGIEV